MSRPGTFLRLNLKGVGESLLWTTSEPLLSTEALIEHLPRPAADLFGPNLAFHGARLSETELLFLTLSRWPRCDEFGRRGLSLAHGELMTFDPSEAGGVFEACEAFLAITRFHKTSYRELGDILETLATHGTREDAEKFLKTAAAAPRPSLDPATRGLLRKLIDHLRKEARASDDPLRIYLDFPAPDELAPCALLGLLALLPRPTRAGGGHLERFDGLHYLVHPGQVPGYRFIDLNALLAAPPQTRAQAEEPPLRTAGAAIRPEPPADRPFLSTSAVRSSLSLALTLLPSLLCLVFLVATFGRLKAHEEREERLLREWRDAVASREAAEPQTTPATDPVEVVDPSLAEIDRLTRDLFASQREVRQEALAQIQSRWASNAGLAERLLNQAEADKRNIAGIYNALQVIDSTDLGLWEPHRERLLQLLADVRGNGPDTRSLADRLRTKLESP